MSTEEIRKRIWNGTIPVIIVLDKNESRGSVTPFYLLRCHRTSYFPLYLPKVLAYFKKDLNDPDLASSLSWWLDFEDVPIRWNWPIGLSYDLMAGVDPDAPAEGYQPWTLTLHYKNYPKDYILALGAGVWAEYWLNQIKEACYIREGTAKSVMDLSKEDTSTLLKSVQHRKLYELRLCPG
jgi:autophagy-related protein 5